jgi:putative Holliday junction resolvase
MPKYETIMAFDFGLRNIGVAVGNTLSRTAEPLTVVSAKEGVPHWPSIVALTEEGRPNRLLVGLPINMDDSESELSRRATKFSRQLEGRLGLPVSLVDERLSSREAKANALAEGHRGDFFASPIDDEAAAIILTTWLNDQPTMPSG